MRFVIRTIAQPLFRHCPKPAVRQTDVGRSQRRLVRSSTLVAILVAAAACSDAPTMPQLAPAEPAVMTINSPDGSSATFRIPVGPREPLILESLTFGATADDTTGRGKAKEDGTVAMPVPLVLGAAVAALKIYSYVELARVCAPPFWNDWKRSKTLSLRNKEDCFFQAATNIASHALARKLVPAVKVTALRTSVKKMLDQKVTHRQLQTIFNKTTKPSLTAFTQAMIETFFHVISNGIGDVLDTFWD